MNNQPVSRVVLIVGSDMTSGIVTHKARIIGAELAEDGLALDLDPRALAIAEMAGLIVDPQTGTIVGIGEEWNKHLLGIH